MRTYRIAAMGGDGIGPEVVEAGVEALKICAERDGGFTLDFQDFDWCRFPLTGGFQWSKGALMARNVHADDRPQARMAVALGFERCEAAR